MFRNHIIDHCSVSRNLKFSAHDDICCLIMDYALLTANYLPLNHFFCIAQVILEKSRPFIYCSKTLCIDVEGHRRNIVACLLVLAVE